MFDWLRKLIKKKSKQAIIKAKPAGLEPPTPEPKTVYKGIVTVANVYEVRKEIESHIPKIPPPEQIQKQNLWKPDGKITMSIKTGEPLKLEETIRKQLLPKPKTHRITRTHSYVPPAERHRDAIGKAMKGKASRLYIKTIKQSPKIKIEKEREN